jgi:hypothetical protein
VKEGRVKEGRVKEGRVKEGRERYAMLLRSADVRRPDKE